MQPVPVIPAPEEFNRILIMLRDYGAQNGLDASTLKDIASAFTHHANLPLHHLTIAAALELGFMREQYGKLMLDTLGQEFLSYNAESTYELAPGQGLFLIHRCVFDGGYREDVRSLLKHARKDLHAKRIWIDTTEIAIGPRERTLISFLRRIGFFSLRDHFVEIPMRHTIVATALVREKPLSLQELEALLAERAQRGAAAENWVLEYERDRLQRAGFPLEASAVAIISDMDVSAGYDIESFDGESSGLRPNRFIEVKSTSGDEIVFFWSSNEIDTARSLGDQYWLYHLKRFTDQANCELTIFQSPIQHVESGQFSLRPWSYRVTLAGK